MAGLDLDGIPEVVHRRICSFRRFVHPFVLKSFGSMTFSREWKKGVIVKIPKMNIRFDTMSRGISACFLLSQR